MLSQVLSFALDIQGLVESPMQTIYTSTLMALSFLDTPEFEPPGSEYKGMSSTANQKYLSLIPTLSVAFGILSIITYSRRAINMAKIWESEAESEVHTWMMCFITTATFRIQVR